MALECRAGAWQRPSPGAGGSRSRCPRAALFAVLDATPILPASSTQHRQTIHCVLRVLCISLRRAAGDPAARARHRAAQRARRRDRGSALAAVSACAWRKHPRRRSVAGIWLAFAAASIAWSALPDASFQSFRSDQFYPFVIFLVSFLMVRFLGGRLAGRVGTAAGTLLCLATMFAAAAIGRRCRTRARRPGVLGWLAWKAGDDDRFEHLRRIHRRAALPHPGCTSRHAWRRWAAAAWLVVFAAIGFLSESRTLDRHVVRVLRRFPDRARHSARGAPLEGWSSRSRSSVSVVSAVCLEIISRAATAGPAAARIAAWPSR